MDMIWLKTLNIFLILPHSVIVMEQLREQANEPQGNQAVIIY